MKKALFAMGLLLLVVFVAFEFVQGVTHMPIPEQFKLIAGGVCVVAGLSVWGK